MVVGYEEKKTEARTTDKEQTNFQGSKYASYRPPPVSSHVYSEHRKLLELAKIPFNENCSAMLLKKLPEKLGDPGKFLIPCNFPGMGVCHALADLGRKPYNLIAPFYLEKAFFTTHLSPTSDAFRDGRLIVPLLHPKGVAETFLSQVGSIYIS
ncbi:hypothetical protein Tco_0271362 [Tanacetum coccineum]